MAPKGKTAPDARSFADPIVYMSKDRTKGFHSFFISFVLAVVQFVLLGLVAKDYFDRPNDYNVNSAVRWNLWAGSTLLLLVGLLLKNKRFLIPMLVSYWTVLGTFLLVAAYSAAMVVLPELFAIPFMSTKYYNEVMINHQLRQYLFRDSLATMGLCIGMATVWCLPLTAIQKCYYYLGEKATAGERDQKAEDKEDQLKVTESQLV